MGSNDMQHKTILANNIYPELSKQTVCYYISVVYVSVMVLWFFFLNNIEEQNILKNEN